jgi:hypothetical protein
MKSLQSTNEELQSLNEELHTVNAEHQLKIKELLELNDDMNNYFRNTEVGQILVDKKMIIKKFYTGCYQTGEPDRIRYRPIHYGYLYQFREPRLYQ